MVYRCYQAVGFILYFYAGLAKLNSDWLIQALPLKIWLPARNDMPIVGFCSITHGHPMFLAGSDVYMI